RIGVAGASSMGATSFNLSCSGPHTFQSTIGVSKVYMQEEAVRWNIKVSKETDLTLRTFLGSQVMKKGALSKFIEEAVRWRLFNRAVQNIKARNADTDSHHLQRLVDGAVREVRAGKRSARR